MQSASFAHVGRSFDGPWAPVAGDLLNKRYQLIRPLADGSMGRLWVAKDTQVHRDVAIKFVLAHGMNNETKEEVETRLQNEALRLGALEHPHVVTLLDIFSMWLGGERLLFVVMELLKGQTLRGLLKDKGSLPLPQALNILSQAALGVAVTHAGGLTHRDIKPDNLHVSRDPVTGDPLVKVIDYGLAIPDPEADATENCGRETFGPHSRDRMSKEGTLCGTLPYMPPEVLLQPDLVSPSRDVFALGVILYQLLTGKHPFWQEGIPYPRTLMGMVTCPVDLRIDGVPSEVVQLINQCTKPRPEERPASRELVERLAQLRAGIQRGDTVPSVVQTSDALEVGVAPTQVSVTRPDSRRRVLTIAAMAIIFSAVASFIFLRMWSVGGKNEAGQRPADERGAAVAVSQPSASVMVNAMADGSATPPIVTPQPSSSAMSSASSAPKRRPPTPQTRPGPSSQAATVPASSASPAHRRIF